MRRIFALESPVVKILTRITDLIVLNLLFIVTSMPLITIGASITSLNTSWQRILHGKDQLITWNYFHIFKDNLLKSTALWLTSLCLGLFFFLDFILFIEQKGIAKFGGLFILSPFVFLLAVVVLITFTYIGRYEGKLRECVKNSILLTLNNPIKTIILVSINLLIVYMSISSPERIMTAVYFFSFGGFSLISLINNYIVKKIFDSVEKN